MNDEDYANARVGSRRMKESISTCWACDYPDCPHPGTISVGRRKIQVKAPCVFPEKWKDDRGMVHLMRAMGCPITVDEIQGHLIPLSKVKLKRLQKESESNW